MRDFPMAPRRGVYRGVQWMQFESTLQLRVPLRGAEWNGVKPEMFHVKVSEREIIARCTSFYVMEELNLRFQQEVDPERCWFRLDGDLSDGSGRSRVLLVEVAKRRPREAWSRAVLQEVRPARSPGELRLLLDVDQKGWTGLEPCRRRDNDDPHITSREQVCRELEAGQTEETVDVRLILDSAGWSEALKQAPHYRLWALDISRKHMKLFLRGDRSKPVLAGEFVGNCVPDRCSFELTSNELEVGGALQGSVPCLDFTIVKASDSAFDWGPDPIDYSSSVDVLDQEAELADAGTGSLDFAGRSPGEWAGELKERATAAFKAGEFREAIEYYTRLLQCTPGSEKLLSNRSVAYLRVGRCQLALDDARKAQQVSPDFAKVYFRQGQALQGLGRLREAIAAFAEGAKLDSENGEWNREILKTRHMQKALKERKGTWV